MLRSCFLYGTIFLQRMCGFLCLVFFFYSIYFIPLSLSDEYQVFSGIV